MRHLADIPVLAATIEAKVEFIVSGNRKHFNPATAARAGIPMVINIPSGRHTHVDDQEIRRASINYNVPAVTTLSGASATVAAIAALQTGTLGVKSLQEYHKNIAYWESKVGVSTTRP